MSTCALLWVHDDHDVIGHNLRYLLGQVDEIMVRTRDVGQASKEILHTLSRHNEQIVFGPNDDRYDQATVMTEMAQEALERGHQWAVLVDPDEIWYANGVTLRDFFAGASRDVMLVKAELYNHLPTSQDPTKGSPFEKIGWRQTKPMRLPKVACRLRPDLEIEHGNHSARSDGVQFAVGPLLVVRHFPWRTPAQFVDRVRTAYQQLQQSGLPDIYGSHVRAYGQCLEDEGEEALEAHFMQWFYSEHPQVDDTLIYDPAPLRQ